MWRAELAAAPLSLALLAGIAHAQGGAPLDVNDPTPRNVFVQIESSGNLATVGQSFGPAVPASYSVSGNSGTLTISAETHEELRGGGQGVPGSFTPIVFQIDVTTLQATSQQASGAIVSGQTSFSFTQRPLGTTTTAGFMGPSVPPLFCTSQAEVDQACMFIPMFCGQTCTLVPGNAYDPGTGEVNLVGRETQQGCDGGMCQGPFDMFTPRGDLRITEAAEIPALPALAPLALFALLVASGRALRRR